MNENVLIVDFQDMSSNIRLMNYAISFSKHNKKTVYLYGVFDYPISNQIKNIKNIKILKLNGNKSVKNYLFVFVFTKYLLNFLKLLLFVIYNKVEIIVASPNNIVIYGFYSFFFHILLRKKLIYDIKSFNYQTLEDSSLKSMEITALKNSSKVIVSNKTQKSFLELFDIHSSIIYDNPTCLFDHKNNYREKLLEIYDLTNDYYIICIPIPLYDVNVIQFIHLFFDSMNDPNKRVKFAMFIFIDHKLQKAFDKRFGNKTFENIKIICNSLYSNIYHYTVSSADLAICMYGSPNTLDFSNELVQFIWCRIPTAVFLSGCVRELIKEENGFVFRDVEELVKIFVDVFYLKRINLINLKEGCKDKLQKWDEGFEKAFLKVKVD